MNPIDVRQRICDELERIEEDCEHSGKSHFNAGERWSRYNLIMGLPSVILSALAGTAFFTSTSSDAGGASTGAQVAAAMSLVVAVLTALMTFLKPSERAAAHKGSGDQYLALRNDARVFRTIRLAQACDDEAAIAGLDEYTKRRNELNQASAQFSDRDRRKAREGIEKGEARHRIDGEKNVGHHIP